MGILLEIKTGPMAGKKIPCCRGGSVAVGRDPAKSQVAVVNDMHMSGIHFTVECGKQGSQVIDRKSSNGTFLNGKRITQAPLSDGDEICTGQTVFLVHLTPEVQDSGASPRPRTVPAPPRPAPVVAREPLASVVRPDVSPPQPLRSPSPSQAAASPSLGAPSPPGPKVSAPPLGSPARASSRFAPFSVGSWVLKSVPDGWDVQEGFGLERKLPQEAFPSTIVVMEEPLGPRASFASYVESQIDLVRRYMRQPRIDPATSPDIKGAEEKIAFDVRYKTKDDVEVFYRRIYARCGSTVGVLTLTTLDKESAEILERLETFWAGLAFLPKERPAGPSQVMES